MSALGPARRFVQLVKSSASKGEADGFVLRCMSQHLTHSDGQLIFLGSYSLIADVLRQLLAGRYTFLGELFRNLHRSRRRRSVPRGFGVGWMLGNLTAYPTCKNQPSRAPLPRALLRERRG